jgi:hypothetical protein
MSVPVLSGFVIELIEEGMQWSKEKGQTVIYKSLYRNLKIEQ